MIKNSKIWHCISACTMLPIAKNRPCLIIKKFWKQNIVLFFPIPSNFLNTKKQSFLNDCITQLKLKYLIAVSIKGTPVFPSHPFLINHFIFIPIYFLFHLDFQTTFWKMKQNIVNSLQKLSLYKKIFELLLLLFFNFCKNLSLTYIQIGIKQLNLKLHFI